jgi:hypothetical protein
MHQRESGSTRGDRRLMKGLRGALLALLALALATRPGGVRAQTYGQYPPPIHLRCSDVLLPKAIKIDWETPPGISFPTFTVTRNATYLGQTSSTSWTDTFDFTSGANYQYSVVLYSAGDPPGTASNAAVIQVVPYKVDASQNQAVDARYDLRYGNPTYLDYAFGAKTYYGGLFAGYASDNSRVARSFLKFPLDTPQGGYNLWAGSVNLFYTRSRSPGTTTVGCQGVTDDSWDGPTLKWSTAPVIVPGNAAKTISLTYASDGTGGNQWVRFLVTDAIASALTGDHTLSVALASMHEDQNGWAYFAKKEYDPTRAPCLLYALRAPLGVAAITITPLTIVGGSLASGTVYLNGVAPPGGAVVSLSSDNSALQVPQTVTVQEGSGQVNFTVNTSSNSGSNPVTVTATYASSSGSVQVTVTP